MAMGYFTTRNVLFPSAFPANSSQNEAFIEIEIFNSGFISQHSFSEMQGFDMKRKLDTSN